MTRSELVLEVCEALPPYYRARFGQKGVRRVIELTLQKIMEATLQGEQVRIRGFGKFTPKVRAPHLSYSRKEKREKLCRHYGIVTLSICKGWKEALKEMVSKGRLS